MNRIILKNPWALLLMVALLVTGNVSAQTVDAMSDEEDENVYEMSPFIVESSESDGYTITETLAGTRIRTDMKDLAASVSTISEMFLNDTGATGSEDLLVFTPNTEVGGLEGNFSGVGNDGSLNEELVAPQTNTRIRGLTQADNTMNYFRTDIPWDSYNVDAVTIQRGPNSVLFGVASPAGIVNAATKRAQFNDSYKLESIYDEFGRMRTVADANKVIIEDLLAVRVIGLDDSEKYRQKQAYKNTERYYLTATYTPKLLGENQAPLNVTVMAETGKIRSNAPRMLPPTDYITPFFDPNKLNRLTVNPQYAVEYGYQLDNGRLLDFPENAQPWLGRGGGIAGGNNPVFIFDALTGGTVLSVQESNFSKSRGVNDMGEIDNGTDGFQNLFITSGVAGFNNYVRNMNGLQPGVYGGPASFWKDKVITDTNVFDFYNNLLEGDNKREWTDFDAYSIALSQTFLDNKLGVEYYYDFQEVTRGGESMFGNALSIDINTHNRSGIPDGSIVSSWDRTGLEPGEVPPVDSVTGGIPNPNLGRAYVNSGGANGSELWRKRENNRFTAYYQADFRDFMDEESWLARLLGKHVFTGLYQSDEVSENQYSWRQNMMGADWINTQPWYSSNISGNNRAIAATYYVSGDLRNANVSSGLGIVPIPGRVTLPTTANILYFDPTWNALGIDPGAEYIKPIDGEVITQSENPDNFVGPVTKNFQILSRDSGDAASLYRNGSRSITETVSKGLTWQAYLLDGHVIPTYGYREDEVTVSGSGAPVIDPNVGNVNPFYKHVVTDANTTVNEGETTTWGVVVKSPDFIVDAIPLVDDLRLFYNESENFSAQPRIGFSTNPLPNAAGISEDYGVVVSLMDGRFNIKATWYETKQTDATIPGGAPLGSEQANLTDNRVFHIVHATRIEAFTRGEDIAGYEWYYNFYWGDTFDGYAFDTVPGGFDNPYVIESLAAAQAVYDNLFPQEWYDAFGYPIDVAKLQSPDWEVRKTGITDPNFQPGGTANATSIRGSNGGRVNGLFPVGTIDQVSKGFELEVTAKLTDNWDLYLNVAKVEAARGSLGEDFVKVLEEQWNYYQGPAGDLRQWWAGDQKTRDWFAENLWKPYQFQVSAEGIPAPEIRPWRANAVTTYRFTDGALNGLRVGAALRWEDDLVLGNELNDAQDNLDPNRPIKGAADTTMDVWFGYNRMISDKINWDIQLNVKSVGEDVGLVPISVNPNGEVAAMRIKEGMRWELRNTFSF